MYCRKDALHNNNIEWRLSAKFAFHRLNWWALQSSEYLFPLHPILFGIFNSDRKKINKSLFDWDFIDLFSLFRVFTWPAMLSPICRKYHVTNWQFFFAYFVNVYMYTVYRKLILLYSIKRKCKKKRQKKIEIHLVKNVVFEESYGM